MIVPISSAGISEASRDRVGDDDAAVEAEVPLRPHQRRDLGRAVDPHRAANPDEREKNDGNSSVP